LKNERRRAKEYLRSWS